MLNNDLKIRKATTIEFGGRAFSSNGRRGSSQQVIAAGRIVLVLAATICVASMSHAQSEQPKRVAAILPDIALLIRGPFGEYSYKLTSAGDDIVTLEEFGGRHMRLEIRQIPDKSSSLRGRKRMGST
jgi:hypothetical protein